MLAILSTHPIQYQVPLWQALARDGSVPFEVWYLSDHGTRPSYDPGFGKKFAWDIDTLSGYPHQFLRCRPGSTPAGFWKCSLRERLRDRLRASRARALWIQGWQVAGYWQALWEARAAGAELWLRGESNDLRPQPSWKQPLKRIQLGYLFGHVNRFFYIGSANRRLYTKYGVPESRLYPAPYAVDNQRFATQADTLRSARRDLRKRWRIPEDAFCVLFCGKFIDKKRPMDVVKAAQLFWNENPASDLHLLFAGAGELGSALRASCSVAFDAERPADVSSAPLRSGPPASFAGFLNQREISQAYVAADCLVLPSDHGETWGLVVNEALASGLPCLISEACGCAEDLAPPTRRFRLGDVHQMASQLAQIGHASQPIRGRLPSISDTVASVIQAYSAAASFPNQSDAAVRECLTEGI